MRVCLLLNAAISLPAILGGCGGFHGCGTGGGESPQPQYAGSYVGTYTRMSGSAQSLTLTFELAESGMLTGTVTEPSSARSAPIEGRLVDWFWECDNGTHLVANFSFQGERRRELIGRRPKGYSSPWHFNGQCMQDDGSGTLQQIGTGTITLTKQ